MLRLTRRRPALTPHGFPGLHLGRYTTSRAPPTTTSRRCHTAPVPPPLPPTTITTTAPPSNTLVSPPPRDSPPPWRNPEASLLGNACSCITMMTTTTTKRTGVTEGLPIKSDCTFVLVCYSFSCSPRFAWSCGAPASLTSLKSSSRYMLFAVLLFSLSWLVVMTVPSFSGTLFNTFQSNLLQNLFWVTVISK